MKVILTGKVYQSLSNRSPIMILEDGTGRICSFETVLKELIDFPVIIPRKVMIPLFYDKSQMIETDAKITKADVEGQIDDVKITITIEKI